MGSSTAVPQQSVDLLTDGKVSLCLLVNEVSRTPQEVGGEVACLGIRPNQVTASNQNEDSQHVALPIKEPAASQIEVHRIV